MSTQTDTQTIGKVKVKKAHRYNVVFYNDDYTPFDLVVAILLVVFDYDPPQAMDFAKQVHFTGAAIAGTYSKDIAETKREESLDMAARENAPHLKVAVEKA